MNQKNIVKSAIIKYLLAVILIVLFAAITIATGIYSTLISNVLDAKTYRIENRVEDIYESDFDSIDELNAYQAELGQKIVEEGAVLLSNDGALPLVDNITHISLLGQNSVDPVYGGHGSGAVNTSTATTLKESFEDAGFTINQDLWDFYEEGPGSDYRKEVTSVTGSGEYAVNEVPRSEYTDSVINSFDNYNDAAIIFLGRSGGESSDLPLEPMDNGYRYLEIDQNERDMIELAVEHFETIILVVNSNSPLELGILEEYPINAALWIGGLGQTGAKAVGRILNGEVNPSGRVVDTFAYDSASAPSAVNFGDYTISNSSVDKGEDYLVYAEGIYIGYRYYETRYEDKVLNQGNAGSYQYENEVQFPFGYGLSYTSFEWSNYQVSENTTHFTASITVTNTGDVAGKDVVQLYMQSPYTSYDQQNQIEKASVELVGFSKTQLLEPNESETIVIEIDKEHMKSYDAYNEETYILDDGTYYFTAAKDAHGAINNILLAKDDSLSSILVPSPSKEVAGNETMVYQYDVESFDPGMYAHSIVTEMPITNQFDDTSIHYYDDNFTYLSRSNWVDTWPELYENGSWEASSELLDDLTFYRGEEVINDPNATMPLNSTISEVYGELQLADLIDADYNDPRWEALIGQLSLSDMTRIVRLGGYGTVSSSKIGLPPTAAKDGTAGFSDTLIPGRRGMAYPTPLQMAATWNQELLNEIGRMIGEDSLQIGVTGWYAPGINIHRSPYSGRNYEYYSEDPFLSGIMASQVISGANDKGVMTYMKHFALNDQEVNRFGGAYFANEQSIREIFLKGFEIATKEGGTHAVMASMNRLGARWSGAHKGLMTNVLRNEWGFEGLVITDQASVPAMLYQDIISGLDAGTNLWLNTNSTLWKMSDYTDNPTVMTNVFNSTKNIAYSVAQSNAMNGLSSESIIIEIMPWWQKTLYILDGFALIGASVIIVKTTMKLKKHKQQTQ
ncbi:MAG: glycoside hydrolase family 3 N-terminal domain-containing protein [Candidatus Izemoplasma sp.]|nr:glycoside hydrolase family 3 N-terminal domain-containing protein [Candidatus Izemoplasma sp.]